MQYPSASDFFSAASSLAAAIKNKSENAQTVNDAWTCIGYGLSLGFPLGGTPPAGNVREALLAELEPHMAQPYWGRPGHPVLTTILQSLLPILIHYLPTLLGGIGQGSSGAAA